MKIRSEQLNDHLQHQLLPIYLVSGDEPLLKQECVDAILSAAKKQGFIDRTVMHANKSFAWYELNQEAQTLSLFAEKSIIEIHLQEGAIGKEGSASLVEYANNPPPDKLLLIITDKLDSAKQQSKWHTTLERAGATIAVWPVALTQMPQWLQQRAKAEGLQLDPASLKLLCDHVEGNLLAAKQELQKLALLYGSQIISYEQMQNALCDNSRYNVFQLVDALLLADVARSLKILASLQAEHLEPVLVLWALSRELRLLSQLAFAQDQQQSLESIFQANRVFENRKPLLQQALRRNSLVKWQSLLTYSRYIDEIIKGARAGSVWQALSDLCLRMAGVNFPAPTT